MSCSSSTKLKIYKNMHPILYISTEHNSSQLLFHRVSFFPIISISPVKKRQKIKSKSFPRQRQKSPQHNIPGY